MKEIIISMKIDSKDNLSQSMYYKNIIRDTLNHREFGEVMWTEFSDDSIELGVEMKESLIAVNILQILEFLKSLGFSSITYNVI